MWSTVSLGLALAGAAAAASQCDCPAPYVFNPFTRKCLADNTELPAGYPGNEYLYDVVEFSNCPTYDGWTGRSAYKPLALDATGKCSCLASNTITDTDDPNSLNGYYWDDSTETCGFGPLKATDNAIRSHVFDVEECAYNLVYNYPNSFSHCGSRNFCFCSYSYRFTSEAADIAPYDNATGNAANLEGLSNGITCGWDFRLNDCVQQNDRYTDSSPSFILNQKINRGIQVCTDIGYQEPTRTKKDLPTEVFIYVSPTIAACAALNGSICTCNNDARCYMEEEGDACLPYMEAGEEVERSTQNVTDELALGQCGDAYCKTLNGNACGCYETPYKWEETQAGVCGYDFSTGLCEADFESDRLEMLVQHCCDAFKTPCECMIGRLPWDGEADFYNTCGWDWTNQVCRLSAITTAVEIADSGCDVSGCLMGYDEKIPCDDDGTCRWLDERYTCVPDFNI